MLQKFFACEVGFLDAAFSEASYDLSFGCDRGMVCARYPTSVLSFHACTAHKDVLNRIVEHVSHVENPRYVGRRNHHCVGLATIGF